jgi:drug/metabolite transporter (DMT)-like permease
MRTPHPEFHSASKTYPACLLIKDRNVITFSRLRDWALLIFCNLMWGSSFVMSKLAQQQTGPLFATFFPISLASIALFVLVHGRRRGNGPGKRSRMSTRTFFQFIMIGLFGQVGAQFFGNWGVRLSLASNGALLALTLPISTAVMAYFLLGERMTWVRWASFALALAGVVECSGINWKELDMTSSRFILGNLMLFISNLASAFYNVYSKHLLRRYSPLQVLLYSYYTVIVVLFPLVLYAEPQSFRNLPHFRASVWVGLGLLAAFQYFLSMVIFLNVLKRLDATQAGLVNYLIPFFGLVAAALVLHERLTLFMVFGGVLVLASTLLITVYEERRQGRSTSPVGPTPE